MADLAQVDLRFRGREAKLRALLEDLIPYYKGLYPGRRLAMAVWFGKSVEGSEHNLLALYEPLPISLIVGPTRESLYWKTGSNEPPFVNIFSTGVQYFASQVTRSIPEVRQYFERSEVLYFDRRLLPPEILRAFNVITEPSGLLKGWYVTAEEYAQSATVRSLLTAPGHARPEIGLVKLEESADFENCRGLVHCEVSQRWLPLSPGSLRAYTFYNDWQDGRRGYFLFEGGSLYQVLKFEVKTAPEYQDRVLEKLRDDRYVEVYLRTVHLPEQPAA